MTVTEKGAAASERRHRKKYESLKRKVIKLMEKISMLLKAPQSTKLVEGFPCAV